MPRAMPLQSSHTTPPPKSAVTPQEAREFGDKLADLARAQRMLAASALSRSFDFYAREALLGSGSFGSVFVARTRNTRERVAIKLLGWRNGPAKMADVMLECSIMTELAGHPAVVAFRGVHVVSPGVFAIVMEYVAGGELWTHCSKHAPLPEAEARHLTAQILDALAYMHERRIAHRDLKLENIMLENDLAARFGGWPTIKLIDFGLSARLAAPAAPLDAAALSHPVAHSAALARFSDEFAYPSLAEEAAAAALLAQLEPRPADMTRSRLDVVARAIRPVPRFRTTVGSVFYIAPEVTPVRAHLAGYGLAADIWSAGVCLHVMLAQEYPFKAPTDAALLRLLGAGPELRMDSAVWATVSPQARDLVARMLCPSPEVRPTAAQALRHDWFLRAEREHAALLADARCKNVATAAPAGAAAGAPSPPPSPLARLPCFRRRATRVAPLLTTTALPELAPAEASGGLWLAGGFFGMGGSLLRALHSRIARMSSRQQPQPPEAMAAEAEAPAEASEPALPLRRRRLSSAFACLAPDVAEGMRREGCE